MIGHMFLSTPDCPAVEQRIILDSDSLVMSAMMNDVVLSQKNFTKSYATSILVKSKEFPLNGLNASQKPLNLRGPHPPVTGGIPLSNHCHDKTKDNADNANDAKLTGQNLTFSCKQ